MSGLFRLEMQSDKQPAFVGQAVVAKTQVYVQTLTAQVDNSPAVTHVTLHPDANVVEISNLTGTPCYVAFGSPANPTVEPRFLVDLKPRELHIPGGNDMGIMLAYP